MLGVLAHELDEELDLPREVVVEEAAAHARLARDVAEGDAGVRLLGEDHPRGVENLRAPLLRAEA